jgi:hypothetical protein
MAIRRKFIMSNKIKQLIIAIQLLTEEIDMPQWDGMEGNGDINSIMYKNNDNRKETRESLFCSVEK